MEKKLLATLLSACPAVNLTFFSVNVNGYFELIHCIFPNVLQILGLNNNYFLYQMRFRLPYHAEKTFNCVQMLGHKMKILKNILLHLFLFTKLDYELSENDFSHRVLEHFFR